MAIVSFFNILFGFFWIKSKSYLKSVLKPKHTFKIASKGQTNSILTIIMTYSLFYENKRFKLLNQLAILPDLLDIPDGLYILHWVSLDQYCIGWIIFSKLAGFF